jgi:hypothetical protein
MTKLSFWEIKMDKKILLKKNKEIKASWITSKPFTINDTLKITISVFRKNDRAINSIEFISFTYFDMPGEHINFSKFTNNANLINEHIDNLMEFSNSEKLKTKMEVAYLLNTVAF